MEDADLRLDGNAVGGLLGEVFAWETTAARGTCAACGAVLLRIVRARDRLWLDARGLSCLELRAPA